MLFLLTLAGVVASMMAIGAFIVLYVGNTQEEGLHSWNLEAWVAAWPWGAGALAIILAAWLGRLAGLSQGTSAVMHSLGGEPLQPGTKDPDERMLLNIVEEMSIASGVPVPDVYLLDENTINACAVGIRLDQAALGVTRGAITRLNREELQGVVAHEYSHILHGDMALNTNLIAMLSGLFVISQIGGFLVRMGLYTGGRRRSKEEKPAVPLAVLGAAIWCVGSLGALFGRLLQSSISRQREFLADASAVQFTRNPEGLGNALRKLGANGVRGRVVKLRQDCAHMMFSNVVTLSGVFATHPPLSARIQRVLPTWDGTWLETEALCPNSEAASPTPPPSPSLSPGRGPTSAIAIAALLEDGHALNSRRVQAARAWRESLPAPLLETARDPERAPALVFLLLLQDSALDTQLEVIRLHESPGLLAVLNELRTAYRVAPSDRLAVLDLALPALRRIPLERRQAFLASVDELVRADGRIDLFEFALGNILQQALGDSQSLQKPRPRIHIREVSVEVNVVLSVLSRLGASGPEAVDAAFEAARKRILGYHAGIPLELLPEQACGLNALDGALRRLRDLAPAFQHRLVLAALAAIQQDGEIQPEELDAFRAVAAALHVPIPPDLGF